MDQAKFKAIEEAVRIGGKGTVRRKHKRVPPSGPMEMRRLQATLTKLPFVQMPGIEELTLSMADKSEIVIKMPKIEGSADSNTLVITGKATRTRPADQGPTPPGRNKPPPKTSRSPPPPPPPPPPSPSLIIEKQAKKKKPRQRVRSRNKRVKQQQLVAESDPGILGEGGANGKNLVNAGCIDYGGGDDSGDSEKTTVPSEGSDMDQTIIGSQKDIDDVSDDEFESVTWEAENEIEDDVENPLTDPNDDEGDDEDNEDKDNGDDDDDDESISMEMTMNDIMNSLDEFYTF